MCLVVLMGAAVQAQEPATVALPVDTPMWVQSKREVRLRVGQEIDGRLLYPVYAENRLVLPIGTAVRGTVRELLADHAHRVQARLRADFTPFSRPVVRFEEIQLPSGAWRAMQAGPAADGEPVLRLTPPPPRHGGLIRREMAMVGGMAKDRLRLVTAPGKAVRLRNLLYSQLPYHPQQIAENTVWTINTTAPMALLERDGEGSARPPAALKPEAQTASGESPAEGTWTLNAYLPETLSSARAHVGQPMRAIVAEPVKGTDGMIAVPEGAVLQGEITRAKPARRFGRAGELRFEFHQLLLPGAEQAQQVQAMLKGIDTNGAANLALDREGKVQPKPQDKIVVPLLLLALASRPLDNDGGRHAFRKDALASNSLGVIGFIIGTAARQPNVASGIGFYGTALATWDRWIKKGEDTTLRRNTRA